MTELRGIAIMPSIAVMMQIVELCDRGKACFRHLHVELCRDRLEVVRVHAIECPIHDLAPCPERIGSVSRVFGQTGDCALMRVRMQVGYTGDRRARQALRVRQAG